MATICLKFVKWHFCFRRAARSNIERIISNEGNGPPRNPFGGGPGGGAPSGAGGASFEMMVPGHKVGLIIGKGGETIKQLQEQSGAKIVIIQVRLSGSQPVKKPQHYFFKSLEIIHLTPTWISHTLLQNSPNRTKIFQNWEESFTWLPALCSPW